MMPIASKSVRLLTPFAALFVSGAAVADQPRPWQLNLQEPATDLMAQITGFHDLLLWVISLISVFVLVLLVYVMVKFNAKANPTPSKTTHNAAIEVAWTVIPVLILVIIAVPSFRLLYKVDVIPKADMTIKATGNQWYWNYEYTDHGKFTFDANMIPTAELKPGQVRLLSVDNRIVVPINTTVRMQITSADVLHAWTIPAFGIKIDAVPGRLNETWFNATKEGVFYGQCSELCGIRHGFMPIAVEVVSKQKFDAWVEKAKKEYAANDEPAPRKVARAVTE